MWVSIPSKVHVAQYFFYYSLFRFGFVHLPCILSFSCIVVMLYYYYSKYFNVHSSMYFMCETQDQLRAYVWSNRIKWCDFTGLFNCVQEMHTILEVLTSSSNTHLLHPHLILVSETGLKSH